MTSIRESEDDVQGADAMSHASVPSISARMAEVARRLRSESRSTETVLRAISSAAIESIPHAEFASITLVKRGSIVSSPVLLGDLAAEADRLQAELSDGPCVRSAVDLETVIIDDTSTDRRWPRFSPAAAELGIASMICFALYVEGDNFGALNLHSTSRNAFDDESRSIGSLFAAHAAIAFSAVRETEQIRAALTNRDIIGQAKGMLMERYKLGADDAFQLLARLSQESNIKLADVALQVVDAGPGS